jgi:cytochrome c-type biogenesis protein CcmH/NrfG
VFGSSSERWIVFERGFDLNYAKEACDAYFIANEIDPSDLAAFQGLGESYLARKDLKNALTVASKAYEVHASKES